MHQLKTISWNARGVSSLAGVGNIIHIAERYDPEVILVQETFLNVASKIYIPNYICVRKDRQTHGGGVMILVKKSLKFRREPELALAAVECVGIKLWAGVEELTIRSVYIPHDSRALTDELRIVMSGGKVILGGDFNARNLQWCSRTNAIGAKLANVIPSNGCHIYHSGEPTYFNLANHSSSCIDLFITNLAEQPLVFNLTSTRSDHVAVGALFDLQPTTIARSRRDWNRADWVEFAFHMRNSLPRWDSTDPENVDNTLENFAKEVTRACERAVPMVRNRKDDRTLSSRTLRLINHKHRLRRDVTNCSDPATRAVIQELLGHATQEVKRAVVADRNRNWAKFIKAANVSAAKFWRTFKRAKGKSKTASSLLVDGQLTSDPSARANALAKIFANAHRGQDPATAFDAQCEDYFDNIIDSEQDGVEPCTAGELAGLLRLTKNTKSPGADGITYRMLKHLPIEALQQLATLFNVCLRHGLWPTPFKFAVVVAIPKAGKPPTDPASYRPISLLSSTGKLLEKVVANRLVEFCDENNIIPTAQFGFRRAHSAVHLATKLAAKLWQNKRLKKSTGVVCLDIANAFPSVWHAGLVFKMQRMGFSGGMQKIIANFCSDRWFAVRVDNAMSEPEFIHAGCPQGSGISPILYNIYAADAPTDREVDILQFADDTALVTKSVQARGIVSRLNRFAVKLVAFYRRWHISVNASKTQFLFVPFSRAKRRMPKPNCQLLIDGHPIQPAKDVKYLGVWYSKNLLFNTHANEAKRRAAAVSRSLHPMVAGRHLATHHRKKLVKQVLLPSVLYAMPAWSTLSKTSAIGLRRACSRAAKHILGLHWSTPSTELYEDLGIEFIENQVAVAARALHDKLNTAHPSLEELHQLMTEFIN